MFLLLPAYPGSPGQKAVKWLCMCVCVCGGGGGGLVIHCVLSSVVYDGMFSRNRPVIYSLYHSPTCT